MLAVLAAAGKPLTVGQVAQQAARGSEIGIRRSLARLVEQGLVRATLMGRNQVHELIVTTSQHQCRTLADLRRSSGGGSGGAGLLATGAAVASVFGSLPAATATASDIDLLLVHPPFSGEKKPPGITRSVSAQLNDALGGALLANGDLEAPRRWEAQNDRLRVLVEQWTGNSLQIVDMSFGQRRRPVKAHQPLLDEIHREGHQLFKARGLRLWPSMASSDG